MLETTWRQQGEWSRAADRAKLSYFRWQQTALFMTVSAVVLETSSLQVDPEGSLRGALATVGAVLLAVSAAIAHQKVGPDQVRAWIRARSVSEALKTETYLFVTGSGPYTKDSDRRFARRVDRILDDANDLNHLVADISSSRRDAPSYPLAISDYLEERVVQQIEKYYRPKARSEQRRVKLYRSLQFWLTIAAAVVGAAAAILPGGAVALWTPALVTGVAALGTRLSAGHHEHQVTTYTATLRRLERLHDEFQRSTTKGGPTKEQCAALVRNSEEAISVENQGWMVQWQGQA